MEAFTDKGRFRELLEGIPVWVILNSEAALVGAAIHAAAIHALEVDQSVKYDFDIGIIGAGAAGLTVAAGAAQLGAKTLLVEKEKELGGDCLHFGCVPSKTLIRTAHVCHFMKNAQRYGLPRVDVPPVDFSEVRKRIETVISTIQKHDSEERFCTLGAKVEFGMAHFVDERQIQLNGRDYSAKNWVLCYRLCT